MGKIIIDGIKLYANHGCLEEEARVGGNYVVDVILDTDFSEASEKDELKRTVDYVKVYNIVKEEMAKRSKLIETVARRIGDHLKKEFSQLKSGEVKVTKLNAPIGGTVNHVSVIHYF